MRSKQSDLRYAAILAVFACAVVIGYRERVLAPPLAGLTDLTSQATYLAVARLEPGALREGNVIFAPGGFGYEIYYRCTGFLPVACLMVGILAYPTGGARKKLLGLLVGIPILLTLNLVRLVHLFHLGVTRPDLFELAHGVAWEGVVIVAVVGLWGLWLVWIGRTGLRDRLAVRVVGGSYRATGAGAAAGRAQ